MGLFDSLLGAIKEAGNTVQQAVGEGIQNVWSEPNQSGPYVPPAAQPSTAQLNQQYERDARSFDEKLNEILQAYPDVSVDREIPAEAFEQQAGCPVFARGGNRCLPDPFSYRLRRGGREFFIRLWKRYEVYDHAANRQIRAFCDSKGIPVLDFFEYLPNGFEYMRMRVAAMLGG